MLYGISASEQEAIIINSQFLQRRKPRIEDESNHHSAEQEPLMEQEGFVWIYTGGYMPSSLDTRSFPVARDRQNSACLKIFKIM